LPELFSKATVLIELLVASLGTSCSFEGVHSGSFVLLPLVQAEAFSKFRHGPEYFFAWGKNALPIDGSSAEITALLKAWSSGDEAAQGQLAERLSREFAAHSSPGFEE
jgi:hypothetical protein